MKKLRRVVSSSEQGFGMIDTLVATVLLGIAVVAMLAGFTYASMSTRENRERIQATMLAQETLENLKQNDGINTTFDLSVMKPIDGVFNQAQDRYRIEKIKGGNLDGCLARGRSRPQYVNGGIYLS
jgi:Tfp pilus assembly protein PilV